MGRLRGVGASQCWHRELFSVFGDLPPVPAAEDIVLPFRAWLLDGLRYLPDPLVRWRDRDYRQLNRELGLPSDYTAAVDRWLDALAR